MSDYVFTALFGGYERLNELELTEHTPTQYVCFTDDSTLQSSTWEVIVVEPSDIRSAARSSREIKMLGHKLLPMHSRSLYIDNSVRLRVDGKKILDAWLDNSEVAMMKHYTRKTVRGEFFACSTYGLDKQEVIYEQYQHYKQNYSLILNQRPFWGGIIARRNSSSADKLMKVWKEQFDKYSKRDQLSINVSSFISGVPIIMVDAENDSSIWPQWPVDLNRRVELRQSVVNNKHRRISMLKNISRYAYKYYLP